MINIVYQKYYGTEPRKVRVAARPPGSIRRRTDFQYMGGHGTYYRFDEKHFPENLLSAKEGARVSVVLFNMHTSQLDEVVFKLEGYSHLSEKCTWIHGYVDDTGSCFQIKIRYYHGRPLESQILVYASALRL